MPPPETAPMIPHLCVADVNAAMISTSRRFGATDLMRVPTKTAKNLCTANC